MQTANNSGFCLGVIMDSNDNVTGAIPQSATLSSPKRTWKDFSPPTSIKGALPGMAESGNANSSANHSTDVGGGGDDGGGGGGGDEGVNGYHSNDTEVKVDQKIQIMDGPVIRMGMGALTSRRDGRNQPETLPVKTQGVMSTWKDVSPPKEKRNLLELGQKEAKADSSMTEEEAKSEEKNRNAIRTNPFHECACTFRGADSNFQSVKRIRTDATAALLNSFATGQASSPSQSSSDQPTPETSEVMAAVALTTWRDVSPTKAGDGKKKRPESGYFSNDVQSEGGQESREEIDSSLSDSDGLRRDDHSQSSGGGTGGEEACFHSSDYFYEDEFSVQFDTNLREAVGSAAEEQGAEDAQASLPQALNGSYTKFRDSLLQTDLYLGPYESELSGSRTSMEISSSEREMMCSSDVLNFSNDPLFTPTPPPGEQQQPCTAQTVSVDSLTHQPTSGRHHDPEMTSSHCSDPNLEVDCCIRKDAYFLSFNGSQQRSSTDSDTSCLSQVSSHDGHQGGDGSQSDSSHGQDAEDEGSNSYNVNEDDGNGDSRSPSKLALSPTAAFCRPVRNMLLSRYPGRICLEALQDYLLSRSSSTKSASSSRHSCSSNCRVSPLCTTLLSSGDLFMSGGHRRGLRRSSNLTTWKQVKNLKKLGREQNLHERSNSMPNLTAEDVKVVRRDRGQPRTVESMADSFHKKRHSAYILELYQHLMAGSNPPSPTTLSRIDQILFQEGLGQEKPGVPMSTGAGQSEESKKTLPCPSCQARAEKRDLTLNLRHDAQCGRSLSSAATSVSPQSLTLWYGQKNFASQFPPHTAECGVQASMGDDDAPNLNSRSMQTSPGSPGADILNVLHELQAKEVREARTQRREKAATMTRAKSAVECRDSHAERLKAQMRRTVSLSPSRIGMNSFYTHQSLPDLSFLSSASSRRLAKSRDSSSSSSGVSLFDPVQIPIILTPVLEDPSRSAQSQARSCASSGCGCSKEPSQSSGSSRQRRRSTSGRSEAASSGSNFSLSSSSGIEPGYMEPRSLAGLAPELEHLLFLPPHLESAYHQLGLSSEASGKGAHSCDEAKGGGGGSVSSRGGEGEEAGSPSKHCNPSARINRYANETHPCAATLTPGGAGRQGQSQQRPGSASLSACAGATTLDALKEEKTPSPEPYYCHYPPRDYSDRRCFSCHGDMSEEGESSQELDEEKLMMYQRWLQERKPPLKSCLRKRCGRDHRARSLSHLTYREKVELAPEKPPRNRHSIACDGIMPVLVDEDGFESRACLGCPHPPPPHHHHHHHHHPSAPPPRYQHSPPPPPPTLPPTHEYGGEKVVLRRKKPAPATVEGSGEEGVSGAIDDSMRAKRVSFASEVSFHSPNYTPQSSPRRQEGEVTAVQMEDDILTLHVVRRNRGLPHCIEPNRDAGAVTHTETPAATTEPCPVFPALSPLGQKADILRGVMQAAEAILQHFAQARDPFDKVRLGNSQETAEVGTLVVTSLCPAIERVVRDGMKSCLTGLHIFGKIQLSPWRMTETSAEIGPYTRAINELVKQLKVRPSLVSHRQKFYAFLAGLLNLRLLDFWMGYISTKETLTSRFYDQGAILCLSGTSLERQYQDMLLALQPLAVLPFQVDCQVVASFSLADSSYMGESDIDPASTSASHTPIPAPSAGHAPSSSPKRQEVASSPKIVVARTKTRMGASPNRASWAGPADSSQEASFTKGDRMDLSATWDWIKTTTLPKARSLMSDMGLMSSTTSLPGNSPNPGNTAATSVATAVTPVATTIAVAATAVKTSRLSQDLASVGIISSRQNLSVTTSTSTPDLAKADGMAKVTATDKAEDDDEVFEEARPSSFPGRHPQTHTLPAVVIDHGTKRKVDHSSARQRAEDILRRKNETSPQRSFQVTPPKTELSERKTLNEVRVGSAQEVRASSSPLKIVAGSPQRKAESSPIRIQGSPSRQSGSPNRQSNSPSRQTGSPNRQSGSPSRGPLINPGSPKSTLSGVKDTEGVEVISRRVSKVVLEDFPEEDDADRPDQSAASSSPLTAAPSGEKLQAKKEEKAYREGKTDYAFGATAPSPQEENTPPTPAVATTPESSPPAPPQNANQSQGRSRLSGLKKLSPKGPFNIISFFDRLLLPSEKAAATAAVANSPAVPAQAAGRSSGTIAKEKENPVSEWDSTEQASSVATGTSSTNSSCAPSPTPSGSLQTSSSNNSANSSPRAHIPRTQSRNSLSRTSRIPMRLVDSPSSRKTDNHHSPKGRPASKAEKKTSTSTSTATLTSNSPTSSLARRNRPAQQSQSIPVATSRSTSRSETPEVDINANSPEFHPSDPEEMFVEHNPIGQWGGSSSETGQSDGSGQSVSMEEDQSRQVLQAKPGRGGPLKMPAFKYVQALVSCDLDDPDLLTYDLGDNLEVMAKVNEDWLFCSNNRLGRDGLVRLSAVRPVRRGEERVDGAR